MGTTCSSPTERSGSLPRLKNERCEPARQQQHIANITSPKRIDVTVPPKETPASMEDDNAKSLHRFDEDSLVPNDTAVHPDKDSGLRTPDNQDDKSLVPSDASVTPECTSTATTPRFIKREGSNLNFISEPVYRLLKGHVGELDLKPRVVRLFVVACCSDSISERTILETKIFPSLKQFCAKRKYCLELVDNNWPMCCHVTEIRRQLSQQLLQDCILTSSLVLVLIFLNNKLEYSIPRQLSSSDFKDILSRLDPTSKEHSLLESCYTKCNSDTVALSICADCDQTKLNSQCDRIDRLTAVFQKHMTESQAEKYLLSAQEDEIKSALSLGGIHPSHIVMVNRNFVRCQDTTAPNYFNMNDGRFDKHSQTKIHQLKEKVEAGIPSANVIRHSVKWKSMEDDVGETTADSQYLERFTTEVDTIVMQIISDHVDAEDRSAYNNYTGINRRLCEELLHQARLCQRFSHEVNSSVIHQIRNYLQNTDQHPIVLHGPPGSGKSNIIAKMATECSRLLPEAAMLLRFCGMTPYSCNMFSVFHSIIQQIDYLNESNFNPFKDEEATHRSFPVFSERACFQIILDLATDFQPLVILMDDVTADSGSWFPKQLPSHVKMIVTVHDEQTLKCLKKDFCEDSCFIELPAPSGEHSKCVKVLTNPLISECQLNSSSPTNVIHKESATEQSSDMKTISDYRAISDHFFDLIERQFGKEIVAHVLRLLVTSKVGLMSSAIIDLLGYDTTYSVPARRFVRTTWQSIRCCLLPFLYACHHGDTILHMWTSNSIKTLARERYLSSDNDIKSTHKQLCDYLVKRWNESNENSGTYLIHELPYHSVLCGSKDRKLLDSFIFNPVWLSDSIDSISTVHICHVLRFVQTETDGDDSFDLETMLQIIWLSHQALDIDGKQIYSQMIIRLRSVMHEVKRLPKIAKLFNDCRASKVPYVVPSKMCLARDIKEADRLAECTGEAPCRLYVIGSSSERVANLFDEKGEIVIWDLNSGEHIKTLKNVNHPKALSMIDDTRAVILCDRELKLYDLEQGQVVRNFRGVLNLKMPLFSVPNKDSVVALSRNRMYVNVLDIATGEVVATFKAGEDRFLDSLMVSENGKVLVCGDATQKPSPLLVWNLQESRLVHDLRMAQHEFITIIADVTSDGHYVVCACVELETDNPNFLAVYDLVSGQLFKVLKTSRNTTCLATDVKRNCVVSGLETGDFLVWDLVSGHNKFYIHGVGSWFNSMTMASDSPICMSYYTGVIKNPEARTLCLWDYKKGCLLTSFTFDSPLTCAVLSPDGHKVVVGLRGYEDIVVLRLAPMATNSKDDS